jgi:hypothetical protein
MGGSMHYIGHRVGAIAIDSSKLTYLRLTSITQQHLIGTFSGATTGSGITMSSTVTKALGVYADDGGAAIGSGTFARAIVGRHLLTYTGGNREQEAAGVVGQIVSSTGTNRHNMCGVMGSYEARTSLTVDGQAAATDTWAQAAVIGRVGGTAITVNTNGVLAGFAAMSNLTSGQLTNNGQFTAFYAGAWSGTTDWQYGLYLEGGKVTNGIYIGTGCTNAITALTTLSSQTTENQLVDLDFITDSTYLTGTNITYSGGRGSAALNIVGTWSGVTGGYSNIYSNITTSGNVATDGNGVVGIKGVVTNTGSLTDGEVYGAQIIAKHNHATNTMLNAASLIGLEAWAYISAAGTAGTVLGANLGIHNECTGTYGAGSVHRGVQIFCDIASGADNPVEATGLCIWNQAGAWDNAINIVNSGSGFTNFVLFTDDGAPSASTGTVSGTQAGYIKVKVGSGTHYIQLYPTLS